MKVANVKNIPRKGRLIKVLTVNNICLCNGVNLTGECPNVTLCYKQKRTFFNAKFDQIREIDTFRPFFGFQNSQILLGIVQLINRGNTFVCCPNGRYTVMML